MVLQLAVRWLLVHYEIPDLPPRSGESPLGLDDSRRPLGQRLLDVPPPHLEGIERESSLLILRTGEGEQQRFYVAPNIHVTIKGRTARLFELREGQAVTITYHMPGGVVGGLGVATSVRSPPMKADTETAHERADATRPLTATVVKVEPRQRRGGTGVGGRANGSLQLGGSCPGGGAHPGRDGDGGSPQFEGVPIGLTEKERRPHRAARTIQLRAQDQRETRHEEPSVARLRGADSYRRRDPGR